LNKNAKLSHSILSVVILFPDTTAFQVRLSFLTIRENARRKQRIKHGGLLTRVELADPPAPDHDQKLLALDGALRRLATEDSEAARVVELRQFAGLNHEEIAATLGVTVYHARQKWTYARAWLRDAIQED